MRCVLVLPLLLLLAGCVSRQGASGSVDALSGQGDAQAFAVQAAEELSQRHAPAHTPLALHKAPGLFGEALESELRGRGFALLPPDAPGSALELYYTADVMDGQGFVQVRGVEDAFSFSRPLGSPAPRTGYTEPPHTRPVPDEHPLASRPLPETAPIAATVPVLGPVPGPAPGPAGAETAIPSAPAITPVPVRTRATARAVAQRNGVPVADFCRWNQVGANAVLEAGHQVYLAEPPAGIIATPTPVPVPAGVAALQAAPAPVVMPAHTSAKLTLASAATQQVSYEPKPLPASPTPEKKGKESENPVTPPANPAPAPAPDPAPATDTVIAETLPATLPTWEISQGGMLREQMQAWASQAGYSLIWNAQHDYELKSSASFSGVFLDAVKAFFTALQANGLALRVTIYQGNNVMEVAEQ